MPRASSDENLSAAKAIISGVLQPADLYVLLGSDAYLSGRLIKLACQQNLAPEDAEFNLDTIDCSATPTPSADAISNALSELPVMCEKRLLILLSTQALTSEATCKKIAEAMRLNLPYHSSIVLLTSTTHSKTSLAGLARSSEAYSSITYSCTLASEERESWVAFCLQQLGLTAAPALVRQIADRTGTDCQYLQSQLEKLRQYLGERREITAEDIKTVIRKSIEIKSWELTDAIRNKDLKRAWSLAQDMLADPSPSRTVNVSVSSSGKGDSAPTSIRALGLLSYINTYLRSLSQTQHLKKQHGSDIAAIARLTNKKEYQVRKTLEELVTWQESHLRSAFTALCLADYNIKKGRDPMLAIQLLLARLCVRKK
ncbi:hypothetical protein IJT17_10450 [bacterium]|nr:hypothetical protein [bacterium]